MARQGIVENVGGFFGDVASGVGDVIGGVGEHLATGATAVRDAERAKLAAPGLRNEQAQISQLLQVAKSLDPTDEEGRAAIAQKLQEFPSFAGLQSKLNLAGQGQIDRQRATRDISDLARAGSASSDFTTPELQSAIGDEINRKFANLGIVGQESAVVSDQQKIRLSSLFSEGLKSLKKTSKGKLATKEETQAFADKFKTEATNAGASPTAAAALFGELHDEETGKRGVLRNDVLPKGSVASELFGSPTTKKGEPAKKFDDFVQVGTEGFPVDNVPKTRAALGIDKPADQQTMQELEQAAPQGLNVQSVASQDPEAFKQMLKWLRNGKSDNGQPFTMKKALEMMGQL